MTERRSTLLHRVCAAAVLAACSLNPAWLPSAAAQPLLEGWTCCNLRSDGKWISDGNYAESGKHLIPFGTPVKVTGYGRYRAYVEIGGLSQALGNDYSRDLEMGVFAQRYIVAQDPRLLLAQWPAKIQTAIKSARVTPGMTREQVLMALGYPISSETPHLDAPMWRYWLWTFQEFQVIFDDGGRVREVFGDRATLNVVYLP